MMAFSFGYISYVFFFFYHSRCLAATRWSSHPLVRTVRSPNPSRERITSILFPSILGSDYYCLWRITTEGRPPECLYRRDMVDSGSLMALKYILRLIIHIRIWHLCSDLCYSKTNNRRNKYTKCTPNIFVLSIIRLSFLTKYL